MAGFWLAPGRFRAPLQRISAWLRRPRPIIFAATLALLAGALTLLFTQAILQGKPPFIDAMAQLVHARYLAEGRLAGPHLPHSEFWMFQNLVMTDEGWVSQYPPGHVLLLSLGLRFGAVEAMGAIMAALTVFFTALAAERLLPEDPATARVGALLVAISPLMLFLAGSYMNHVSAAAFAALAVYAITRTWDGGIGWAVAAGAAAGAVATVRPLSALVVGGVLALALLWGGPGGGARSMAGYLRRLAAMIIGALPLGLALALYNARFFGSPFRFGYTAAQGPRHGLGFHPDPWGNMYGLTEAVGYTSSDLVALSLFLLQTPIPVVALVGLYLIVARTLGVGARLIAAWALLPVLANFFYWHHDLIMGPRMLAEAAPAWALLSAVAAVGVARRFPAELPLARVRFYPRSALSVALLVALLVGLGYFAPRQAVGYGGDWQSSSRISVPRPDAPSLVFVHEPWADRLGARLAARGLRQDSVTRLLRSVNPCVLQGYLDGWLGPAGPPLTEAQERRLATECQRQARSDRRGTLGIASLLWQGDLPGLPPAGAMLVRDLGPALNESLLEAFPERRPLVLDPAHAHSAPRLLPYDEGMDLLWPE